MLWNSSKDEHAGERSTTSPAWARPQAAEKASRKCGSRTTSSPEPEGGDLVLQRAGNSLSGGAVAHGNAAASGNRVRQ